MCKSQRINSGGGFETELYDTERRWHEGTDKAAQSHEIMQR